MYFKDTEEVVRHRILSERDGDRNHELNAEVQRHLHRTICNVYPYARLFMQMGEVVEVHERTGMQVPNARVEFATNGELPACNVSAPAAAKVAAMFLESPLEDRLNEFVVHPLRDELSNRWGLKRLPSIHTTVVLCATHYCFHVGTRGGMMGCTAFNPQVTLRRH